MTQTTALYFSCKHMRSHAVLPFPLEVISENIKIVLVFLLPELQNLTKEGWTVKNVC